MDIFNKIDILKKIGWYDNAELSAHEKLTCLFNCMVEYFNKEKTYPNYLTNEIYIGGYYPINTESSFSYVIKRGHKYIDPTHKSIHQTYNAYCDYLRSPEVHSIAHDLILNPNLEFELIDLFIAKTYK